MIVVSLVLAAGGRRLAGPVVAGRGALRRRLGDCSSSATPSRASRPSSSRTGGSCWSACAGGWRSCRGRHDPSAGRGPGVRPGRVSAPAGLAGAVDGGRRRACTPPSPRRWSSAATGRCRGCSASRSSTSRSSISGCRRRRLPPSAPRSSRSGCPAPLVALAGAAAIGWLMRAMFGTTAGLWAAICYATMLLPFAVSLSPLHDLAMVPLVTVAIGAFWHARHAASAATLAALDTRRRGRARPVGARQGPDRRRPGRRGRRRRGWSGPGHCRVRLVVAGAAALTIALVVAWPWYAAMERAVPGYLQYFFMERHVGGLTDDTQRHAGRPFSYYLPVVIGGGWPWMLFLLRRRDAPDRRPRTAAVELAGRPTWCCSASPARSWPPTCCRRCRRSPGCAPLRAVQPPVADGVVARLAERRRSAPPSSRCACPCWSCGIGSGSNAAAAVGVRVAHRPRRPARAIPLARGLERPGAAGHRHRGGVHRRRRWSCCRSSPNGSPAAASAVQVNTAGRLPARLLVVDEGIGSFVFYLRPDLRRTLSRAASSACRGSRSATSPARPERKWRSPPTGCPAWPRSTSSTLAPTPAGSFLIRPLAGFRRRPALLTLAGAGVRRMLGT